MYQIVNWLCYISVSFLVLEMMVYMCKDIIKLSKSTKKIKFKNVGKSRVEKGTQIYTKKIAK